jgi:hypothetical protein
MASPTYDIFTHRSFGREMRQTQTAVTGAPGGVVFDQRWDHNTYAMMRTLQNSTSNATVFDKWIEYDTQHRLSLYAAKNFSYSALGSPLARSAYAYSLPKNPPGVRAP